MVKYFLLTYYRNASRKKLHTTINCVGLSIAISVIILIFIYVNNELTYDRFHKKADSIYRLTTKITTPGGSNNLAIANTSFAHILKKECPEIESLACIDIGGVYHIKYKDRIFRQENIRLATQGIFDLFSYSVLKGNPKTLLSEPNTTVLTETLAKKLFDNTDPIGKMIAFEDKNYTVTGVIKDLSTNTDLTFAALLASTIDGTQELLDWDDYYVYFLLNSIPSAAFQNKIDKITSSTYKPLLTGEYKGISIKHILQPLPEIHFDTSYLSDGPKGNKTNVFAFSCIVLLILIIACINYINLNVEGAINRVKEIQIRKINGSGTLNIIIQLLGESVITIIISLIISLILVLFFLPVLNELTDKKFDPSILASYPVILIIVATIFFIGIISGLYPVVYQLILIRKNNQYGTIKSKFSNASKALVTIQFILAIAMICAILVISKQINFMKKADLGFTKDQILAINFNSKNNINNSLDVFKHELTTNLKTDKIATGSVGTQLGSSGEWMKSLTTVKNANNADIQFVTNILEIDDNYLDLFGIKLLEGRNFSKSFPTDYKESVIVNQTYAKIMGWKNPIGQTLDNNSKLKVIGVVNDFHFVSLHNKIEPLTFSFNDKTPGYLFLKISPLQIPLVKSIWNKFSKDSPFEYQFVDENFEKQYRQDEKQKSIFRYLSIIGILISCMGLYGLSVFFITKRTKEIGIRKVNGARVTEILTMLNKDFIKWVVIAFFVACPIAWYAMHKWLQNFAYKTDLSWWVFAVAGIVAVVVAVLTVSWQSWRAATRNPVEALRYE